jgi:hypothetical protein
MSRLGNEAVFLHSAIANALLVIVMAWRASKRPTLPEEHKEGYVVVPRTSPVIFDLDPRADVSAPQPKEKGEAPARLTA